MDIRNIVYCTPEQFETLHREGQVVIDGVVRKKEDGVLYYPGELPLLEWFNKVMSAELGRYEIAHTPSVLKTLNQEWEEIVESNFDLKYGSAVGFRAFLKNGDTIKASPVVFINGEKVTNDYTYIGEGLEFVSVWVFEGKTDPSDPRDLIVPPYLNDAPTFTPYEVNIKAIGQTPEIHEGYYLYANEIETYSFTLPKSPLSAQKITANGRNEFTAVVNDRLEEIESDCTIYPKTTKSLTNKTFLKKVSFPKLKNIEYGQNGVGDFFLYGCTNPDLIIDFSNLESIGGTQYEYNQHPFESVAKVTLPPSVKSIGDRVFKKNKEIVLLCNGSKTSFSPNWCSSTPESFTMAQDWKPSINIAVAAAGKSKEWFIDLFANYLYDHSITTDTGDGGLIVSWEEITIPNNIFTQLTDEEKAIAAKKNWTVRGA